MTLICDVSHAQTTVKRAQELVAAAFGSTDRRIIPNFLGGFDKLQEDANKLAAEKGITPAAAAADLAFAQRSVSGRKGGSVRSDPFRAVLFVSLTNASPRRFAQTKRDNLGQLNLQDYIGKMDDSAEAKYVLVHIIELLAAMPGRLLTKCIKRATYDELGLDVRSNIPSRSAAATLLLLAAPIATWTSRRSSSRMPCRPSRTQEGRRRSPPMRPPTAAWWQRCAPRSRSC